MIQPAVEFGTKVTSVTKSVALSFARRPRDMRYIGDWLRSLQRPASPLAARVPWLPYAAIEFLEVAINERSDVHVFEYGGGGSTVWFSERAGQVITVEHDRDWYREIAAELDQDGSSNCELLLRPPDTSVPATASPDACGADFWSGVEAGSFEAYVMAIDNLPNQSQDIVLVDGRCRSACLRRAAVKVKTGGIMLLDDSDREAYQEAMQVLAGWTRHDFHGIRRFSRRPSMTTCSIRP